MQRKLSLVIVTVWIDEPLLKCVTCSMFVLAILCANFLARPYINDVYDVQDLVTSASELIVLGLSMLILYRTRNNELAQENKSVDFFDSHRRLDIAIVVVAAVTLALCMLAFGIDVRAAIRARKKNMLRDKGKLRLNGEVLEQWMLEPSGSIVKLLSEIEKMLTAKQIELASHVPERTAIYKEISALSPMLVDCLLDSETQAHAGKLIRVIQGCVDEIEHVAEQTKHIRGVPTSALFNKEHTAGIMLRFLVECGDGVDNAKDVEILRQFVEAARGYVTEEKVQFLTSVMGEARDGASAATRSLTPIKLSPKLRNSISIRGKQVAAKKRGSSASQRKQPQPAPDAPISKVHGSWKFLATSKADNLVAFEQCKSRMLKLLEEACCEAVLLIPVAPEVKQLCVGLPISRWGKEDPKGGKHPDWLLQQGSPAALCVADKAPVHVNNIYDDF